MTRRNLLDEILSKRGRCPSDKIRIDLFNKRYTRLYETSMQLFTESAKTNPEATIVDAEVIRYFPIALVACIEGYFRMAIADLINIGPPFIERVANLRDLNISVDVAIAIQTQKITLGEYISHFLSLNNLEDINKALSVLLNFDFLERLLTGRFDLFGKKEAEPFHLEELRGPFVVSIKELFHTRHILCHEFAPELRIDNSQIMKFFTCADLFVGLSEVIIWAEEFNK